MQYEFFSSLQKPYLSMRIIYVHLNNPYENIISRLVKIIRLIISVLVFHVKLKISKLLSSKYFFHPLE